MFKRRSKLLSGSMELNGHTLTESHHGKIPRFGMASATYHTHHCFRGPRFHLRPRRPRLRSRRPGALGTLALPTQRWQVTWPIAIIHFRLHHSSETTCLRHWTKNCIWWWSRRRSMVSVSKQGLRLGSVDQNIASDVHVFNELKVWGISLQFKLFRFEVCLIDWPVTWEMSWLS